MKSPSSIFTTTRVINKILIKLLFISISDCVIIFVIRGGRKTSPLIISFWTFLTSFSYLWLDFLTMLLLLIFRLRFQLSPLLFQSLSHLLTIILYHTRTSMSSVFTKNIKKRGAFLHPYLLNPHTN